MISSRPADAAAQLTADWASIVADHEKWGRERAEECFIERGHERLSATALHDTITETICKRLDELGIGPETKVLLVAAALRGFRDRYKEFAPSVDLWEGHG